MVYTVGFGDDADDGVCVYGVGFDWITREWCWESVVVNVQMQFWSSCIGNGKKKG